MPKRESNGLRVRRAPHGKDYCGACGNCSLHCRCGPRIAETLEEAKRRWDEGIVVMGSAPEWCLEADLAD